MGSPLAAVFRTLAAAAVGVGLSFASGPGCGRTPIIRPCTHRVDEPAVLTCDPNQVCEAPFFSITNRPANALLVLDRSCSMAMLIEGRTKWERAVEAVIEVVEEPRTNLRWGLSVFPDRGLDACRQGPIAVPVDVGQEGKIEALLTRALDRENAYFPGEPCGTNLAGATQQLLDDDPFLTLDGRDYVVLITDGAHAGCSGSGLDAVDDVAKLFSEHVSTVVVGFGGREETQVLQQLGEAGGVPASDDVSYHLAQLNNLNEVLQRVVNGIGCRHPLSIDAPLEDVRVRFDGVEPVPRDLGDGEGWTYHRSGLVFSGDACEQLLSGAIESIDVSVVCD